MSTPAKDPNTQHGNCEACDNTDADINYVQCDACDSWWHFSCANVTDSVSDRAWICSKCMDETPPNAPAPRNTFSNSSRLQRDLALLKQRQELERQRMEHELQMKFLDEQLKLLDNHEDGRLVAGSANSNPEPELDAVGGQTDPPAAYHPVNSRNLEDTVRNLETLLERCQLQSGPTNQQMEQIKYQLQQCKSQLAWNPAGWNISPSVGQHRYDFPNPSGTAQETGNQPRNLGAYKKTYTSEVGGPGKSSCNESGLPNKMYGDNVPHKSTMIPPDTNRTDNSEQQNNCPDFGQLPFDRRQEQRIPFAHNQQQRVPFARSMDRNVQHSSWDEWYNRQQQQQQQRQEVDARQFGPSSQQLAARQSLARDLPQFSGDPSDWPIFISNYEYTTASCGYTDGENMLRLQRCLKGPALETVRSRLVLPAAVPQVIEALRMRYGRPELLINALLEKVRTIPAPKPDRLEGLIEYGMAVQALCDHIEAANEHAHLSNPMLLQELVGKLPADQKLMWAG